jgi:hypothetical protein
MTACSVSECGRAAVARSMCDMHWKRWRKNGDPTVVHRKATFESMVARAGIDDCWPWTGPRRGTAPMEYGSFYLNGSFISAHVHAWMLANGSLPALPGTDKRGTCILHSCDNPLCCNPKHLRPGTHTDNMQDALAKKRTTRFKAFCANGHPRTPDNLYTSKAGLRQCRICNAIRQRAYRAQRSAARRIPCSY